MTSVLRQAGTHSCKKMSIFKSICIVGQQTAAVQVSNIEARISAEVYKKQIRMKTFFEDYDKLRKGYCIEDKFITGLNSALSMLSINLTLDEIRVLVDKYRVNGSNDLIKYSEFIEDLERVFANPDYARATIQSLKQSENQETAHELLNYIKWQVASKRILIKLPLQDYDRTKAGVITKDQFIRVLDNLNLVRNPQMVAILCKKYANASNPKEIHYMDFVNDVENIRETEAYVVKGIIPNEKVNTSNDKIIQNIHTESLTDNFYLEKKLPEESTAIENVIKKIQAIVTLKRIRIKEFFYDYDGLRKNIVTGDQFKRILMTIGVSLTDQDFKEIVKVYNVDPEPSREQRIKWMDFCEDVDTVFTRKELDKNPLVKVPQIDKSVFEPVRHIAIQFTSEEQQLLEEITSKYQKTINQKRIHLKPLFEDFDTTKIGYVTKNQFVRIMKQFDLVPQNDQAFNLLLKKYMDKGNLNEVNYYQFVKDVDIYNEDGKLISAAYASAFTNFNQEPRVLKATIKSDIPLDLSDLMNKMRGKIKEERIRVSEFMKDFDKLKHGTITKEQFRLSLGMAKLPLSEAEFTLILNGYQSNDKPGFIRWKQFCDDLDNVFTIKELEKTLPNETVPLGMTSYNYGRAEITPEETELAEKVKNAFREYLLANRLDTKQLFENWDKLNRFKVSPKQFRQVLATVGFNISEEECRCISKMYRTDDEKEVKYLEFLKDTKPYDYSYMTVVKDFVKHGTGKPRVISQNIEDILFELRRTTKINRLRYKEYCKDFDPLNKGTIKKNKFKSVIYQTMKVPLDERMFDIIEKNYECENDATMINYFRFCDDMDIVFNLPDREKDPLTRPTEFNFKPLNPTNHQETIEQFMQRLGEAVNKRRLLLKPFFQDKDVAKIGRVSFTRMRSILDNNKLPLTEEQYELLSKAFAYDAVDFNYLAFIEALKHYETEQ